MVELLTPYLPSWIAFTVAGLVQCVLLLGLVMVMAAFFTWLERKVSARIQDRLGPTRTGGRFGWLQAPADGLKLLCKEDIIPTDADSILYRAAPYVSFASMFALYMALPWAYDWTPLRIDSALFFVIAVSSLEVFGVILGGYASGSKWALYGAMREASQVISYEIPMGLCSVIPVILAGTLDLVVIGQSQSGWFWNWYIFHDPFTFVTFWIYFTCAVAHTNRAPFDLPEAESELVAGFLTEYSGFRWATFFMAEYGAMMAISALAAILFLGGWNGPIPVADMLGLRPENHAILGFIGNSIGLLNLLLKAFVGVTVMMWLRWTLPRLRVDQVMTTCLKYCLPLASAAFVGVMVWNYVFPGGVTASVFATKPHPAAVSKLESAMPTLTVNQIADRSAERTP